MRIRKIKNQKSKIKIVDGALPHTPIYVLIISILFFAGVVCAEENLEELRNNLLQQEKEIQMSQRGTEPQAVPAVAQTVQTGNKGYVYSGTAPEALAGKPVYEMPDVQTRINQLYSDARKLFIEGKFDEASSNLEEVISLNPMYVPARRLLDMIKNEQIELAFQDNVITQKERMIEIDKAWLGPEEKEKEEAPTEEEPRIKTVKQKMMEEKAQQVIPEINFTDAHIRDVLKYLSDISGINIVIDEDLFPKMEQAEKVPERIELGETGEAVAGESMPQGPVSNRITISLVNIPLIEALKYILSAKGLKYRIDEYAIVVSTPERLADVEMETRYYHLSAGVGVFTEFAKRLKEEEEEAGGIKRGLREELKITIKDVLEQSGVPFPPGSKVFLDKRTGTLIVRNTPQDLILVEEVLRMLDITPFQVEIEARFVELTQETAQELGLEWMITSPDFRFGYNDQYRWDSDTTDVIHGQYPDPLNKTGREGITHGLRYLDQSFLEDDPYKRKPSGNILSISGVLTNPEFRMILHALSQSGNSNVLSSPKVTTLNNQQAQIEVVDEIIYPTEYELTPATTNDTGGIVTQPVVTPGAWKTRDVGIILNVTPSVGADKRTITLGLKPEVSKVAPVAEWFDYGIKGGENWSAIPILQPKFFTKLAETNVVIHDGETVVLGGLIKEDLVLTEDKIPLLGDIPILGRLFRSNTETSKKTNLLIFVTANLLAPTGERIRK